MRGYRLIGAEEVMERLGVSRSMAYRIIKELNSEMEKAGKKVIAGRVDELKFMVTYFADIPRGDGDER